jgi:hypothetical protein
MDSCIIENMGQVSTKKKGKGGKDAMLCFFCGVSMGGKSVAFLACYTL